VGCLSECHAAIWGSHHHGSRAPHIPTLGTKWRCQLQSLDTLSLVPTGHEAGWDTEPVWKFSIKEQSNVPTGNRAMIPGFSSPLASHYTD
jgi:hypothetical protein